MMSYHVQTLRQTVDRLQTYIQQERPLNIEEMANIRDVLMPLSLALRNVATAQNIGAPYLANDWVTIRRLA